ncbi:hypothetical protein PENTCL1PPCAC_8686, partial [Pristionchus entomophagus]
CRLPRVNSLPEPAKKKWANNLPANKLPLKEGKERPKNMWQQRFNKWYNAHLTTFQRKYPLMSGNARRVTVRKSDFLGISANDTAFWKDLTARDFYDSVPLSLDLLLAKASPDKKCGCMSPYCNLPSADSFPQSMKERKRREKMEREASVEL